MATEANTQTGANRSSEVAFGLSETIAAAASYVAIFGLVLLFVEEDNEFVRFHAAQAVVFGGVWFSLGFVLNIASAILATLPGIGAIAGLLPLVVSLAGFVLWLVLVYKAYSGEQFGLPVFAGIAKQVESAM